MGSNGTMRFTWTASMAKVRLNSELASSNGTMRFTWTASVFRIFLQFF